MSCSPEHKGWNYFQAHERSSCEKEELHVNSTTNTFQKNYENFD